VLLAAEQIERAPRGEEEAETEHDVADDLKTDRTVVKAGYPDLLRDARSAKSAANASGKLSRMGPGCSEEIS
jgi:hypothetical protein